MTQEQLKEQFLQYAENNLHNDTILQAIIELLDSIINEIYYDYPNESNKMTTCSLILKRLLEESEVL